MKLPIKQKRAEGVDPSPKLQLAEAADKFGVEVNWLRSLVARSPLTPALELQNPRRWYYSTTALRRLIRESKRGPSH